MTQTEQEICGAGVQANIHAGRCAWSVCAYVCASHVCFARETETGWQRACHCSRTLLLLSGAADGCLSERSVTTPIQRLTQMLNADLSPLRLIFIDQSSTFGSILPRKKTSTKAYLCGAFGVFCFEMERSSNWQRGSSRRQLDSVLKMHSVTWRLSASFLLIIEN